MELNLRIDAEGQSPQLILDLVEMPSQPFFDSMAQGFSTEIIYHYRLRKKSNLGFLLPPSGKTYSQRIIYTGKKDFLTGGYFIIEGESRHFFNSWETFSVNFFSCSAAVPEKFFESDNYIIEARAIADLLKRPPPLTLLDPFYRSEKIETKWVQLGY